MSTPDGRLPTGASGVVHDTKSDGSRYLVEFTQPFFVVIDVPGEMLVAA